MKNRVFNIILVLLLAVGCTEEQQKDSTAPLVDNNIRVQSLKPRAIIILKNGLNSKDPYLRSSAIEIAVETKQKDMLPLITKLTIDPIVPVRFNAMVALGDIKCFSCEKIIRKGLNDPNANVRIAAAYSMVKLNKPKYVGQIVAAAKNADQTVRANAALLLGKLGNPDHIPLLYEILHANDSVDKVRLQAVESIARLGDEQMYRSKLWALLISKFADDRVMGIRGMGALDTPESRNAIVTTLEDDIQEVRLVAAEQLARLGDERGEEQVFAYFQTQPDLNKTDMANQTAVMAIGSLKSSRLNNLLPKILNSQSPYIQLLGARSVLIQLK